MNRKTSPPHYYIVRDEKGVPARLEWSPAIQLAAEACEQYQRDYLNLLRKPMAHYIPWAIAHGLWNP